VKLVGMLMAYNESEKGNLAPCLNSLREYCDEIVVYDDGSTDNSLDVYKQFGCHVIQGEGNDFKNELAHKQRQIDYCKAIGADWIFRIDADEILDWRGASGGLRSLLQKGDKPSYAFHTINFWRSPSFYRLDNSYNDVVFNRLWRCTPDLHFEVKEGLHLTNYPVGATDGEGFAPFEILHYGFASTEAIIEKYDMYKAHGQSGWALNRLIDEGTLRVAKSKQEWFQHPLPNDKFEEVFDESIVSKICTRQQP
jgi:glycosyltransferase involved in cell wall biosynthesis